MASNPEIFIVVSLLSLLVPFEFCSGQDAVKAAYWFPESGFEASDIDSSHFTHLFCAFAGVDSQTKQVIISSANNVSFSQFTTTVKLKNPSIKTLVSIGGGNADPTVFASMASDSTSRRAFIDSSIALARSYGFYGLDLDWEYPQSGSEMVDFGSLLEEWRAAVDDEAQSSDKSPLILTAAVHYAPNVNGLIYPVQFISRSLDWINVMAYDFYSPSKSKLTNSHAALYDPSAQISGSYGIGAWSQAGITARRLVLGMPFYGYAWRLADASNHGFLAQASGPVGPDNGVIGYNRIRSFIAENKVTKVYNSTIVSDYCYASTTWIGYDDTQTISSKVSYAKQKGLLGYFAWHVGVDDNWALSRQATQAWGA